MDIELKLRKGIDPLLTKRPSFEWDESAQQAEFDLNCLLSAEKGLKILWWNVMSGELAVNNRIRSSGPLRLNVLESNLYELIQSSLAPDILAFAEFNKRGFSKQFQEVLLEKYPYFHYESVNEKFTIMGQAVFSKTPLKSKESKVLGWGNNENSSLARTQVYSRRFNHFEIEWDNKNYHFFPVHFLNFWPHLEEDIKKIYKSKYLSKGIVGAEVFFGRTNPHAAQLNEFLENIGKNNFTPSDHVLIVGDFNVPKKFSFFEPYGFKKLRGNLKDLTGERKGQFSFPSLSSPDRSSYPRMQIDHCFGSAQIRCKRSAILPLKGSDHYPLYLIVE